MEHEIARLIEYNAQEEARAIQDYVELLQRVDGSTLAPSEKAIINEEIKEIIADELNHQQRLQELFVQLTDIEPNKE